MVNEEFFFLESRNIDNKPCYFVGRFAGNAGNLGETKKLTLLDAQELKRLLETTNHDSVIHSNGWGKSKPKFLIFC